MLIHMTCGYWKSMLKGSYDACVFGVTEYVDML